MSLFLIAAIAQQASRNEEDLRLMLRVKQRDQSALGELYDRYSPVVFTQIVNIVKETEEAEDLLQEVFLQIWNKASLFAEEKGSVYTWVITITRRKAIDRLRSKDMVNRGAHLDKDDSAFDIPDAAYASNPLLAAMGSEYDKLLRRGLAQLSQDQRAVIELSYYEGFTQEQIAQRESIPLGTVKTRMRQGLMKLRDYLQNSIRE